MWTKTTTGEGVPAGSPAPDHWEGVSPPPDQRPRAVVGEQLQQHRVRHLSVEDDDRLDALLDGVDAGFDLGDHAARDGAVGDEAAALVHGEFGQEPAILVE